jgi:hypothetical protein
VAKAGYGSVITARLKPCPSVELCFDSKSLSIDCSHPERPVIELLPTEAGRNMRIFGLAAALALCCATVSGEKIAKPGADPIQAELMEDLHARLLKVGETVYAHVTVEWRSPGCVLRNGAVLEAHVVSVVPSIKPVKASEVGLAFTRAQCGDLKMGPLQSSALRNRGPAGKWRSGHTQ